MSNKAIQNIFYLSGFINIIGTIVLSKFFSNETLINADPIVMSPFGLILITVWGLAFIAVASTFHKNKWIIGVFAIEKLSYVLAWGIWYSKNEILPIYDKDIFAGLFYCNLFYFNYLRNFTDYIYSKYVIFLGMQTNNIFGNL